MARKPSSGGNGSVATRRLAVMNLALRGIEADLVDTALRDSAFEKSEAIRQVLSAAKNIMVALPGQLYYSTQIPVCLWFLAKNKPVAIESNARLFDGETELSLVA